MTRFGFWSRWQIWRLAVRLEKLGKWLRHIAR